MTDEREFGPPPARLHISKWLIALTVMLPTLSEIIDTSVVNVSLDYRRQLSAVPPMVRPMRPPVLTMH